LQRSGKWIEEKKAARDRTANDVDIRVRQSVISSELPHTLGPASALAGPKLARPLEIS
jgi:hypothetical protein